jgi:hypothetical protein
MITMIKVFTYRGDPLEEWSNSYHLSDHPADRAGWASLAHGMGFLEQHCYTNASQIKRALCYDDSDNPVTFTLDGAIDGGFDYTGIASLTGGAPFAGDQAATVAWDTGLRGSTGKPIYLRKYFHGGVEAAGAPDSLQATYLAALEDFCDALLSTPIDGTIYFADKNGRVPDGPRRVDPWSTTRTLKRRGRRPTS